MGTRGEAQPALAPGAVRGGFLKEAVASALGLTVLSTAATGTHRTELVLRAGKPRRLEVGSCPKLPGWEVAELG